MGLRIETWNIAYRRKANNTFQDTNEPFTVIPNGYKGWYADPFLFDYQGDTYLFAEFFSYQLGRGVISVAKYDSINNCFGNFREIIRECYHLSYPVVFEYNNQIYMMPECAESQGLFFYRAVEFPSKWEKTSVLDHAMKLADTTPFQIDGDLYALTLKQGEHSSNGELILMKYNGSVFQTLKSITDEMLVARPGGNMMNLKDSLIRVSQDCEGDYGKAVNFIIVNDLLGNYHEEIFCQMTPDAISVKNAAHSDGIHTYNSSRLFEVVDLKYYKTSFYRLWIKLFGKKTMYERE